jgi:Abortive infection C-terminus
LTNPLTREIAEQTALVQRLNTLLAPDKFRLKESGRVSGMPLYKVQRLSADSTPADSEIARTLAGFTAPDVHERWQVALHRRATDPGAAITSARTLLEDTCKWILHEADIEFGEEDELPVLYRHLAKLLKLAPDDYTEQVFKQILGSCQSIVASIGSIRNKLGDAHSQGPRRARPLPRHAELAVNLAGTMATFLIATWEAKKAAESETQKAASHDRV